MLLLNFCFFFFFSERHIPNEESVNTADAKKARRTAKRHSAPILPTATKKSRLHSPFSQTLITNGDHSDEFESPKKLVNSQRSGTTRSFRDASGKLRFLCSISTCTSRVPRQSELYCKRHQIEYQTKVNEHQIEQMNGTVRVKSKFSF